MTISPKIWDDIYLHGNFMLYPSEFFVRLMRSTEAQSGIKGITLDHGCGSGNNAECLFRAGHAIACSEVSQTALDVTRDRLVKAGATNPSCHLVDPSQPLEPQLPKYDNVVSWLALCYAPAADMAAAISQLIEGMSPGGFIWFATPTKNDLLYRISMPGDGPSRTLGAAADAQEGAIMTIFDDHSDVEAMFAGTEVLDSGTYSMMFSGVQHEYMVIHARKPD